jgi:membrane-associated protease RseP (regulator of RpoE activity)
VKGSTGMIAALALLAHGARAQGGAAAGSIQPSRVMISTRDSGRVRFMITPQIDSLIQRLNSLPVSSAEYFATEAAFDAAITAQMRSSNLSAFRVEIATPRAAIGQPMDVVPLGRLGFTADGMKRGWYGRNGNYLQYFEYPTVIAIESNSPASRSGVKSGDMLVAYDGLDVTKNPINMTQLLVPGRDVVVKLRRDGDVRDVQMTVEKAPADLIAERRREAFGEAMDQRRQVATQAIAAARGSFPTPTPRAPVAPGTALIYREMAVGAATMAPAVNGVLGAAMTELDPGLATAINGAEGKHGVLVTRVPVGSLADRTGIRSGDVILAVDASEVSTVAHFRARIAQAEQNGQEKLKFGILRGGKLVEITYFTR